MLGGGAAAWTWFGTLPRTSGQPAILASALIRRTLLIEIGMLAVMLPLSIAGTQLALAVVVLTLLAAYQQGARARLTTPLDLPVAALLAAAAVATVCSASPTPPWGVTALRTWLAFFVLTRALAVINPSERDLGRIVAAWAGASALGSGLAFLQHWSGFDAVAALGFRTPVLVPAPESPGHFAGTGTFASRLTFAHATAVTAATLLGVQLAGGAASRRTRWLWAAIALEVTGVWSTFARGAWFAITAVGAAALGVAGRLGKRARALSGLAVVGSALAVLLALSPGTLARGQAGLRLSANNDRLFLWARAAEVALDHPLVGVGFGSYHLVLGPYYDRFDPAFPMRTWAHDMPLSMLCETGPMGLFAFLWLLIEGLGFAREALGRSREPGNGPAIMRGLPVGAALATLAFAVISAFHDATYDGVVGYNLFFSMALGAWAFVQLRQSTSAAASTAPPLQSSPSSEVEVPASLP
jgi:O-antigen ligase